MFVFEIIGQRLVMNTQLTVEGTIDYLEAEFLFHDEDWANADKWAHFTCESAGQVLQYDLQIVDDKITKNKHLNLGAGTWKVYVHGTTYDGTRITTEEIELNVKRTGLRSGEVLLEVPLSAAEQISVLAAEAREIAQSVREDADAGAFDGEDGFSPLIMVSEIEGGHRVIVASKKGQENFDVLNGADGEPGDSPTVNVESITGGNRITVTDKNGSKYFDVMNGEKGDDGFSPSISSVSDSLGTMVYIHNKSGDDSFMVYNGKDGYSPSVDIGNIPGGHRVYISTKDGQKDFDVMDGEDGESATIDVVPITGGHRVTVTDKSGSKSFNVMDGEGGFSLPAPTKFGFSRWPSDVAGTDNFYDMAYGNGQFVAIGSHDGEYVAMITTDFVNFRRVVLSERWQRIKFVNNRFFVIGQADGIDIESNTIKYSDDGVNWTEVTLPTTAYWRDIEYGEGYYVVISGISGDDNSNISAYSADLSIWTQFEMPYSDHWFSLAFGNGHFVALAYTTGRMAAFYPNATGANRWTDASTIGAGIYFRIYFHEGKFYIPLAGNWGESTNLIRVGDVLDFEFKTLPIAAQWQTMAFGAGYGVVFANSMDGLTEIADACYTADGGETWEHIVMPMKHLRYGSAYGRQTFVCIGREYIEFCYLIRIFLPMI